MTSPISAKKLVITAFLSSFIIGMLAFASITIASPVPFTGFPRGMLVLGPLILVIWAINIALVYLTEKYIPGNITVYARYVVSYLACFALVFAIQPLPKPLRSMPHKIHNAPAAVPVHHARLAMGKGQGVSPNLLLAFALNSIILLIQDLTLLRDKKSGIELENAELKIKNMEATNHQLKQQIRPHFLFNSLNTLKTLIRKEPDKAEDYLVNLSDFLRASLLSNSLNISLLHDELKLAVNYLEMQTIRFDNALQYTIHIPEQIQQTGFVPVFSILPLLENAIKHNILTKELPLQLDLSYSDGRIFVVNNLQPRSTAETGTGFGLKNLSERYKILSDEDIILTRTDQQFSVAIKILDNANSHHRG